MISIKKLASIFFFFFAAITALGNDTAFTIGNTLQSNMVVQQGKPLVMWGNAESGTKVTISASWQRRNITATASGDGKWSAEIPVPNADSGKYKAHTIEVKAGGNRRLLDNILFGDVWLCSGQSNMDMTIKPFLPWLLGALNYQSEIDNAQYPQIRLFDVRTDFKAQPQADCGGQWKICSPVTAPDFSAVAYFFARELFRRTGIPQGLITSAVGASSCQAWTSRETLSADNILSQKYLYPYDTSARSKETLDSVVTFEKVVRPTLFYNAMIHPLRQLNLSGFLWYQGESNKDDGALYTRLCSAMINNWRMLFRNDSLPFYYVQVAPYTWQKNDSTAFEYAVLREAQYKIRLQVPHTGIAVIMDIADPNDIHPRNKQDVGYRLAKNALYGKYRRHDVVYRGPEYKLHRVVGDTLIVSFREETIGSGLATNDGLAPKHFYLANASGKFVYADAAIVGSEIHLYSSQVHDPVHVRYAFTNYPVTNFGNHEGMPAVPFRTDTINDPASSDTYAKTRMVSTAAPQWEEMLKRDSGWIGADGIYAVPLNGVEKPGKAGETETLFWFSDNIWGTVKADTLGGDWQMAHNCVAYFQGETPARDRIKFFGKKDKEGKITSMFEPHTPKAVEGDYYWLGDGFFNHSLDSTIYIFAYRIKNVPGGIYPFDDVGLSLIAIPKGSKPPFANQRQMDTPFFLKDSKGKGKVVFGISVLANTKGAGAPNPDGYIYVYGARGPYKELLVARVEDSYFEDFTRWRFWNGTTWVKDIHESAPLTDRISNEMSVSFREDGRVVAVYQLDTNSPDVVMQVASTPVGPFQPRKKIWSTPEIYDDADFYTYNAKAHPHLSKPGELLISYNVNSFDFLDDIIHHPWHLRPRFFTVKY